MINIINIGCYVNKKKIVIPFFISMKSSTTLLISVGSPFIVLMSPCTVGPFSKIPLSITST